MDKLTDIYDCLCYKYSNQWGDATWNKHRCIYTKKLRREKLQKFKLEVTVSTCESRESTWFGHMLSKGRSSYIGSYKRLSRFERAINKEGMWRRWKTKNTSIKTHILLFISFFNHRSRNTFEVLFNVSFVVLYFNKISCLSSCVI